MNLLSVFKRKKKQPPYPDTTHREIKPNVSTIVPQEYLDKTKEWDKHLYENITIISKNVK